MIKVFRGREVVKTTKLDARHVRLFFRPPRPGERRPWIDVTIEVYDKEKMVRT